MEEFEAVQNLVVSEQPSFASIMSPKQNERLSVFSPEEGGFLGSPVLEDLVMQEAQNQRQSRILAAYNRQTRRIDTARESVGIFPD